MSIFSMSMSTPKRFFAIATQREMMDRVLSPRKSILSMPTSSIFVPSYWLTQTSCPVALSMPVVMGM